METLVDFLDKNVEKDLDMNINEFDPMDLLPFDKSFFTYNSNEYTNHIVFHNSILIPFSFKTNFINKVYGSKIAYTKNLNAVDFSSDDNITVFYKKIEPEEKPNQEYICGYQPINNSSQKKSVISETGLKLNSKFESIEDNNQDDNIQDNSKTKDNTKVVTEVKTTDEKKENDNLINKPQQFNQSFWTSPLMIVIYFIIIILILGIFIYMYFYKSSSTSGTGISGNGEQGTGTQGSGEYVTGEYPTGEYGTKTQYVKDYNKKLIGKAFKNAQNSLRKGMRGNNS